MDMLFLGSGAAAMRLAASLDARFLSLSGDDIDAALSRASSPKPDLIIYAACADEALQPRPLHTLGDDNWREGVGRQLELLLGALHALGRRYQQGPPPIVMIGPSLALSGAEGLVMLSATAEGQRALMKSAARQWGPRGFRFTWVAVDPVLYACELKDAVLPVSQDPDPLALGRSAALADLQQLLSWLADPRAGALTGQSLALDGGELMLP